MGEVRRGSAKSYFITGGHCGGYWTISEFYFLEMNTVASGDIQ